MSLQHSPYLLNGTGLTTIDIAAEPQRVERLVVGLLERRDIQKHESLRIATQCGHEQMRELGISIGYVILLLQQGQNDVGQIGQGLVDVLGLGDTSCLFVLQSFRAGQVDQIQISDGNLLFSLVRAYQSYSRDGMRSG